MARPSTNEQFRREYPRLSPNQQSLLLAALTSRQTTKSNSYPPVGNQSNFQYQNDNQNQSISHFGVDPSVLNQQPTFDNTLFPNLDSNLDTKLGNDLLDFADPFSDLPEVDEHHEKRKSPEDDEEDEEDDEDGGSHKRQEGEDKVSKKPGRKPLTTEPTTKRKAQNRAAQRAFRERKEKHLKDLEQKVVDLEKASESANHENGLLKAQVERLHSELREYRKRLSTSASSANRSPTSSALSSFQARNTKVDDFQFDFTNFGNAPGELFFNNGSLSGSNTQSNNSPVNLFNQASVDPLSSTNSSFSPSGVSLHSTVQSPDGMFGNGTTSRSQSQGNVSDGLAGLFSPTALNSVGENDYAFRSSQSPVLNQFTGSNTRTNSIRQQSVSHSASDTTSPSASSLSQNGPTSSCGTSPEPILNSPATKLSNGPEERRKSEGEKTFCDKLQEACGDKENPVPQAKSADCGCYSASKLAGQTPGSDLSSFDWLASQNGGQFDPVLFGDYRESQDAIIGGSEFTGGFFEEAFPDFDHQLLNAATDQSTSISAQHESLLTKTDNAALSNQKDDDLVVPGDDDRSYMTCQRIWSKLQDCPQFQTGDFDIDSLCSELQMKAKCSESGVVVPKQDVEAALWKLAGVDSQNNQRKA